MAVNLVEDAKKKAACKAIDDYITRDGMVVGIGSGSTIVYAVERLGQKVKENKWTSIVCLPTSFQSIQLINQAGLTLTDLHRHNDIDVTIDGADEVDTELNCIKGGGGCQTQEKIIAYNAKHFVVIADFRKDSTILGDKWTKGVPIEVLPMSYTAVSKKLEKEFSGKPKLRMAVAKMGPCVTDNGNVILDVDFGKIKDPHSLAEKLNGIPGIIEHGLFVNMAERAYFGQEDGSVVVKDKKH